MKIKKILIVPVDTVVEKEPQGCPSDFLLRWLTLLKRKIVPRLSVYESEIIRYADIPKILGNENVFIYGELYPHFYSKTVPKFCPYPSCHGVPAAITVREKELPSVIKEVDAVLVSVKAAKSGRAVPAIRMARARDIPVAMIDTHDHEDLFMAEDARKELFYGFQKGKDFDIFFKTTLPIGCKNDFVLPIAPVPARPESYQFRFLPKTADVFYSGRQRAIAQPDRDETVSLIRANFPSAMIFEHVQRKRKSFIAAQEYWDNLSRARLTLSPSGRVWDSFRHAEAGLAHETALIAPRPYVETTGPVLRDGVNAILYDTEFRGGRCYVKDPRELVEKVRYYLKNPEERKRIANQWAEDVKSGHTVYARSKYILESMEKAL